MSFLTREISRLLGRPITLYYFRWGSDSASFYAYTDAEVTINATGSLAGETVDYLPLAISRDRITASGTLDKAQLNITAPRDCDLASLFIAYPPPQVVTAIIRQAHRGETDSFPANWVGRVLAAQFEGSTAKFSLEPIATSMRRTGLRRNYQYGCPLPLYGGQCRADKTAATVDVAVTSISGQTLVLPSGWFGSIAITKYLGGLAQWTTPDGNVEIRTILRYSGTDNLVLGGVIRGLTGGNTVHLSLGCNHQLDDCTDLHVQTGGASNAPNYGGQPWIPFTNPVGKSLQTSTSL